MNKSVKSALAKLRNATPYYKKKAGAGNRTEYTSASFLISSDHLLFLRESIVLPKQAGILAYNISAVLPKRFNTQWTLLTETFVTYSCATAHDLHMVPF